MSRLRPARRRYRVYYLTSTELWTAMLLGWMAIPMLWAIRREHRFEDEE